jgi:hypothetical protein
VTSPGTTGWAPGTDPAWPGELLLHVAGRGLTATVAPDRGGKVVALTGADGTEWLLGPPTALPPPAAYGDSFVDADMCGWDETIPTIDACTLAGGRDSPDVELPDHGEAWAVPWSATPGRDDALTVRGRALPWQLTRAIGPTADGLRLSYVVEALGAYAHGAVPVLWAAHPQFLAPPGSRVVLPDDITTVLGTQGEVTDAGTPREVVWDDTAAAIDTVLPAGSRKVWLRRQDRAAWAAIVRGDGRWLRLAWDPSVVPYLGIWFDAGAYARAPVLAIEPSTGWYDRLDRALAEDAVASVTPGTPLHFDLTVTTGEGPLP